MGWDLFSLGWYGMAWAGARMRMQAIPIPMLRRTTLPT